MSNKKVPALQKKPAPLIETSPLWLKALLWASWGWAALVVFAYCARHFPSTVYLSQIPFLLPKPEVFLRYGHAFAAWLLIFSGALSIGFLILKNRAGSALSRFVLSSALGYLILSNVILFSGLAKLYRPGFFMAAALILAVLSVAAWKAGAVNMIFEAFKEFKAQLSRAPFWISLFLGLAVLISFVMAFVPEIFYDAMVYHLGTPRWYLLEGGVVNYSMMPSKYPLLMQMLYLLGLAFQGEAAAKLIHWSCGVLLLLGSAAWASEENEAASGLWAAMLFLLMPMTQFNWWTTGVDVGISVFSLLAFWMAWRALKENSRSDLILAGLFAGSLFAVKYTGGVPAAMLGLALAFFYARKSGVPAALKAAPWFALAALAVAAPWLVKNWLFTGNPFFPFLHQYLGGAGFDPVKFGNFRGENIGMHVGGLSGLFTLPWRLTFENLSSLSYPGPAPLALLPLLIVMAIRAGWNQREKFLTPASLAALAAMLSVNRLLRYSMPALIPYLSAAAVSLTRSFGLMPWAYRAGWAVLAVLISLTQILSAGSLIHHTYYPYEVLSGRESPRAYLSYTHPGANPHPATAMYDWAKQNLPAGSRLLILGDEKGSSAEIPFDLNSVADIPLIVSWSEGVDNAEQFHAMIKRRGITHILVNLNEGRRLKGYGLFNWPERVNQLFGDFWQRHIRLKHQINIPEKFFQGQSPLLLYEVLEAEAAKTVPAPPNPVPFIQAN